MTEGIRADLRERAIPVPPLVAGGPQRRRHAADERRYRIPTTVISCTMPATLPRGLMAAGHPMARELTRVEDVEIVELPTGHWPQLTKPDELAAALLGVVDAADG